jgi:hypothetical protein
MAQAFLRTASNEGIRTSLWALAMRLHDRHEVHEFQAAWRRMRKAIARLPHAGLSVA